MPDLDRLDSDPNGVIFQAFHAYLPDPIQHWQQIQDQAKDLAQAGFTALWLPRSAPPDLLSVLHAVNLQVYSDGGISTTSDWVGHTIQEQSHGSLQRSLFCMSDDWLADIETLHQVIRKTGGQQSFLDIPLHFNFHRASRAGGYYNMAKLLDGTLMQQQPALAVTFVENYCSQPLQPWESLVESWFKPLAYATILLRREGYPCVFAADYYGAHYRETGRDGKPHEIWLDSHRWLIDKFLQARQTYAHGRQYDYFDQSSVVGWTRLGTASHPKTMAVVMSDGWGGSKWMEVGKPDAEFYDLTEHFPLPVYTNPHGWGEFYCKGGSVSVWVEV
ncbi:MAG: hypothetical protein ACKO7W_24045 [Elainella sp.]